MRRLGLARPAPISSSAALASMVDLLTILLVFLLRSYSTDPPVRPDDHSFSLPDSVQEAPLNHGVALDLTEAGLFVDGARLASTRWYLENDDALVRELYDLLLKAPPARLQLRADEDLPYEMVRKVLFTAQQAGVTDLTVVAVSRASL